jgi:hypothetical protein
MADPFSRNPFAGTETPNPFAGNSYSGWNDTDQRNSTPSIDTGTNNQFMPRQPTTPSFSQQSPNQVMAQMNQGQQANAPKGMTPRMRMFMNQGMQPTLPVKPQGAMTPALLGNPSQSMLSNGLNSGSMFQDDTGYLKIN